MLGKLFKSLFGGGGADGDAAADAASATATLDYNGFTIEATPLSEGGQFRTAGYISGEHEGEVRRVQFIRADVSSDKQTATDHALSKGKQIIDEQGPGLLQRASL